MSAALSGPQKAAVVLAQLNTVRATKVLGFLSEDEVVELMSAMATLPVLGPEEVRGVLGEFGTRAAALAHVRQGGIDVARKMLRERLGAARAEEVLQQFVVDGPERPLAVLQRVDAHQIAGFVGEEHPQTVAVVLAHLPPDLAAEVLGVLAEDLRTEVARRIATMGRIAPDAVAVVDSCIEHKLAGFLRGGAGTTAEVGGVTAVVAILNQSDRAGEKQILSSLEETDPELAEDIRNEMFVFDDVVRLDDRTLQRVLRNVVPKDLAVALKGVDPTIRATFLRNMSERAARDLEDEIDLLGPTRLSQVETAQRVVVKVVRDLDAAGEIVLARGEDAFV